MPKRFLFIILFFVVLDVLSIQAPLHLFGSTPWVYGVFAGSTLLVIVSMLVYFRSGIRSEDPTVRQILLQIFFVLLFPKLIMSLLMVGEDIFRGLALIVNGISDLAGSEAIFETGRSTGWSWFTLIFGLTLTLLMLYGALFNVYRYRVHQIRVKLMQLPKAFEGLRVVQISDIHSGSLSDKAAVEKAVDRINALQPDLIFFTGDLVNNIAEEARAFTDVFSRLQSTHGVYSVLGNHDYGDYVDWPDAHAKHRNLASLKELHAQMGWRLLLNEHVHIEKDGEKIVVAGVENWSARGRFVSYGNLQAALQGIESAATILLLSHDPSHWEAEVLHHPAKVDITFSGHTHGMQFGWEWMRWKWSPVQYIYKHWAGLYHRDRQYLYVNRGFGVIGYPGRVGILPEITMFTLSRAEA